MIKFNNSNTNYGTCTQLHTKNRHPNHMLNNIISLLKQNVSEETTFVTDKCCFYRKHSLTSVVFMELANLLAPITLRCVLIEGN